MKRWQLIGTTVVGASFLLGACGGSGGSGEGKDVEGEVKGDGSSTVGPIIEKLNEKFAQDFPNITVSSGTSGTGGGFEKFISGSTDFANASRPIKDEEKKKLEDKGIKYEEFKVAKDGVTIAVNKENDFVDELDKDQLKQIYSGEAKSWKDVNPEWPDKEIKAFSPDQSHGTYDFFTEEVMDDGDIKAEKNADTNVIVSSVQDNKQGIGYFGYNFYEQNKDKLKAVKIKGDSEAKEPTKKSIQNGSYALSRDLYVYANEKKLKDNKAFQEFIGFILDDKGKAAEDAGYVALPEKTYKEQQDNLKDITGGDSKEKSSKEEEK
ncbi:PstS family phosphate ABC transporter substrate-binding protein [Staphylococcus arlettae]|jgi:phosphate transport system substrate-binding protein|uniref:Phosphate-binding protein n=4 Tax=Staphylococcus arlettae TaxID=29378 RepID=A0A2T7BVV0_9STAP|nr:MULTISPECIES: PstS family phosphate ABC transporter substrate-binding protein [Staphylococcus]KAB2479989.1 PstS family phosphate ABC transporter substrate-binding protein [Staphylococcus sp. CH99b_3]MBF0737482.1 PstS family phosphate ABC transporter substrate-binding protein [Staphylococcus arlettae]MBK3720267.1 Phosphate-binding protein PstS precursor [Staphylococcus arlettae]MCD8838061.1 PstS family phosphate ABC transporter substrate-binding protein [Staphylococcus arlettae]MCD8840654.1 